MCAVCVDSLREFTGSAVQETEPVAGQWVKHSRREADPATSTLTKEGRSEWGETACMGQGGLTSI